MNRELQKLDYYQQMNQANYCRGEKNTFTETLCQIIWKSLAGLGKYGSNFS